MSEEVAMAIADAPTIAQQAEQIAQLEQRLAAALAEQGTLRIQLDNRAATVMSVLATNAALVRTIREATAAPSLEYRLRGWAALCAIVEDEQPGADLLAELARLRRWASRWKRYARQQRTGWRHAFAAQQRSVARWRESRARVVAQRDALQAELAEATQRELMRLRGDDGHGKPWKNEA